MNLEDKVNRAEHTLLKRVRAFPCRKVYN